MDKVLTHPFMGRRSCSACSICFIPLPSPLGDPDGLGGTRVCPAARSADAVLPDGQLKSLVLSGIIDGVGGVMSFVPLIMLIFLQIAFLEDTGYMARMAYMLDRIFRIFGLHAVR